LGQILRRLRSVSTLPLSRGSGEGCLNTSMRCCSQSRCARIDCAMCARRYAARLAKRIQNTATGTLFVIEMMLPSEGLADFWSFRIQCRNLIDHRRRSNFWWRSLLLHVWMGQDGKARGVASLGSLTSSEVFEAFQSRWPTNLRAITPDNLKLEIVSIIQPGAIYPVQMSARYQTIKLAVWPPRQRARPRSLISPPIPTASIREPMPILF
jgi:hypothetical protein